MPLEKISSTCETECVQKKKFSLRKVPLHSFADDVMMMMMICRARICPCFDSMLIVLWRKKKSHCFLFFATVFLCWPVIFVGGVREALFGDENYTVMWGKRSGFAKVALQANVVSTVLWILCENNTTVCILVEL